jgi:hypothetical protein
VADIQARATVVTTKGRNVIIPNAIIFMNPVAVGHSAANPEQLTTRIINHAHTGRSK